MPSREKRLAMEARAAARREAAKTNPAIAAAIRKKRAAIRKMLATRAAKKAAAAAVAATVLPEPAQLAAAADLTPEAPASPATPSEAPSAPFGLKQNGQPRMDPKEVLRKKREAALTARATLAEKRASGTLKKRNKRYTANPNEDTLPGRIDLALERMGKTLVEMARETGISASLFHTLRRGTKSTFRPVTFAKIIKYLGVDEQWLKHGEITPDSVAARQQLQPLVPHASTVFKANGKHAPPEHHPRSHEGRIEQAMQGNIDTTITVLWSLLPLDAKVMVIARVAELVAMGRK